MAYYTKTKTGWRVQIERRGVRKSQTFLTKSAAQQWATREEAAIIDGKASRWPRKTVGDALDRYGDEVSSTKRSGGPEVVRLVALRKHFPELAAKIISEVTAADLSAWRDARLKVVTAGSVQRDINLLRNVWNVAAREWGWLPEPTPWRQIRMPGQNEARSRLAGWREIRAILRRTGFRTGQPPRTATEAVGWAFLLSLRTAMRAGELLSLTPATVDLARGVVTLAKHKTLEKAGVRHVPLTPQGLRLLKMCALPLPVAAGSLDALFRRARDSVLVADLHFHDARGTALTHLSRKVDVLTLARISGHTDLRQLLTTYYRESAADIAARLARPRRPDQRPTTAGGDGSARGPAAGIPER